MKLLRLSFKNINSLAGEWHIDFTRPEYGEGVFLIAGDTGSGKTSILDALSLALYGRTARQPKFSKTSNEVMTRGTGECWAEASFSCEAGVFTARWSQRRAHGRPGGALQACEVTLRGRDGELADHRAGDAQRRIAELIGLDFAQFRRTAMLSQGQFDRFLTAKPDERSAILQQATGIEIYTEIGKIIHSRWQRAKADAALALGRKNALSVLSDGERAALQCEYDASLAAVPALQAQFDAAQSECRWHDRAAELDGLARALDAESALLDARAAALEAPLRRLAAAQGARALDSLHAALETARRAAESASAEAARRAAAAAEAARRRAEAAAALQTALAARDAAAAELDRRLPAVNLARRLDAELAAAETSLERAGADLLASETARAEAQARVADLEAGIAQSKAFAGWLELALGGTLPAPPPPAGIPPGPADTAALLAKARADCARAEEKLAACRTAREAASRTADAAARSLAARRTDLESAIKAADDAWRLALQIRQLSDYREVLADGEPCPLCGSTSHPYRKDALPSPDERKSRLEALQTELAALREADRIAAEAARKADRAADGAREKLDSARARRDALASTLSAALAGASTAAEKDSAALRELRAGAARREAAVAAADGVRRTAAEAVVALRARRADTGIEGSPDDALAGFRGVLDTAAAALSRAETAEAAAATAAEAAGNERRKADDARSAAETAVSAAADSFLAAAAAAGFPAEADWLRARWTDHDIRRTEEEARTLAADRGVHKGKREALAADRAAHAAAAPAEPLPPAEAAAVRDDLRARLDALQQAVGEKRERLRKDDAQRAAARRLDAEVDRTTLAEARWKNLNDWLGRADGGAFRSYAQGITLRLLLDRANPHLRDMTSGRYEMLWSPGSDELLPQMLDRHQGGILRPVSNLSGGERFQVSLALALGLSDMTSRALRSGTLFLDEGFGTLDERALDTALDTLERLREDGKAIGVISHVKELADRFGTQIHVRKTGGTGRLEGPGVTSGPP